MGGLEGFGKLSKTGEIRGRLQYLMYCKKKLEEGIVLDTSEAAVRRGSLAAQGQFGGPGGSSAVSGRQLQKKS
jgi:hypothetical protein